MSTLTTQIPATTKQVEFYASLAAQFATRMGGLAGTPEEATEKATAWAKNQSMQRLSDAITDLKTKVNALPKPKAATVEPGYYTLNDKTYFVTTSKAGNTYAKLWTIPGAVVETFTMQSGFSKTSGKAKWVYAPGAIATLAGKSPMTLEEAKKFGHAHGYCIRCGAQLTDPKSVEAGIGPICAGYWA
jgi:hypothetical protein